MSLEVGWRDISLTNFKTCLHITIHKLFWADTYQYDLNNDWSRVKQLEAKSNSFRSVCHAWTSLLTKGEALEVINDSGGRKTWTLKDLLSLEIDLLTLSNELCRRWHGFFTIGASTSSVLTGLRIFEYVSHQSMQLSSFISRLWTSIRSLLRLHTFFLSKADKSYLYLRRPFW